MQSVAKHLCYNHSFYNEQLSSSTDKENHICHLFPKHLFPEHLCTKHLCKHLCTKSTVTSSVNGRIFSVVYNSELD